LTRRLLATTGSEAETEALGRRLAARLAPDGTLLLSGDLGAGKTVLARGVAAGLGIPPAEVQSPTYTLIREHRAPGGGRFVHLDLYRLNPEEAAELGLDEVLAAPGVKVVEWAERLGFVPPGAVALVLERSAGGRRIREVEPGAPAETRSRTESRDIEEEIIR
jgi:tRNA threonylcarbamoyladenosine biosynthesis protein TsaE